MKTLFPKQQESVDFLRRTLLQNKAALDTSQTGVGKTVISSHLARVIGYPVAVVCPKIVIPHWERELAEVGISPVFVLNHEKIKRGSTEFLRKVGKKLFRWSLPENTLLIWDEVHKCKAPYSQNSQMLIAAKQAGHYNLMLSATACQDPTEMRSIGYALNLHSLNKSENGLMSWNKWMESYGCRMDQWRNWVAGPLRELERLNGNMYGIVATKLTPKDLPSAFAENHIITEPLAFASLSKIKKYYEENGITPEIVDMFLEGGAASPHIMVQILRARQLAEIAKVPDIIDMVWDARSEGSSVAIFVNFSDTLEAIRAAFPTGCSFIAGGQSATVREENIQAFQSNRNLVIVSNIAAGGLGVSLHDETGDRPRVSLISPTFNVKEYIQTLGRIHRAGAKSPALQRVLVASGSIEERVMATMEKKRIALETLHAQQV